MKIKLTLSLLLTLFTLFVQAQESGLLKVAVFDPSSSGAAIDEGTIIAVREIVSSVFVNSGDYAIVERSLLDKVMNEAKFTHSDVVDDSQATELGKLAGADKVVLSVLTRAGSKNMLSVKLIDVKTATVEKQQAKVVSSNDLLDFVEPLTLELLCETVNTKITQVATSINNVEILHKQIPLENEISFYFEGGKNLAKEEHGKYLYTLFLDKTVIGTFTLQEGFSYKIKDAKPGKHNLRIGGPRKGDNSPNIKIDTTMKNDFEFVVVPWKYLGVTFYKIIPK